MVICCVPEAVRRIRFSGSNASAYFFGTAISFIFC